jgi:magnesium-transporting ATPase (P-type)
MPCLRRSRCKTAVPDHSEACTCGDHQAELEPLELEKKVMNTVAASSPFLHAHLISLFLECFDRHHLSLRQHHLDALERSAISPASLRILEQLPNIVLVMENAFLSSAAEVLKHFEVTETAGLSSTQVADSRQKYGTNTLAEDPPTPLWQLVLEQFKDQLVIILLGSAAISFVLALFEEGDDWTAFVDPVVVSDASARLQLAILYLDL